MRFSLHEQVLVTIGSETKRGVIEIDAGAGDYVVRLERTGERLAANERDIRSVNPTPPPIPGMRTA